jgi:hypothetical protein
MIQPNMIPRIHKQGSPPFLLIENIHMFLRAIEALGINRREIFEPIDLFEEKNIPKVINCLLLLEDTARRRGFKPVMLSFEEYNVVPQITEADLRKAHMLLERSDDHKPSKSVSIRVTVAYIIIGKAIAIPRYRAIYK